MYSAGGSERGLSFIFLTTKNAVFIRLRRFLVYIIKGRLRKTQKIREVGRNCLKKNIIRLPQNHHPFVGKTYKKGCIDRPSFSEYPLSE